MLYSIIDKKLGKKYGLLPHLHQLTANGTQMVVNENELRLIDSDINAAAAMLGGRVMDEGETFNELKKIANYE